MINTISPTYLILKSPKIKVWLNISDKTDIFTGLGILWIIDFKRGIARKQMLLNERILNAPYPEFTTRYNSIDEFLLNLFTKDGFDIRVTKDKNEKELVEFTPALMDRFEIEK
jgi:hypothetical protein